MKLYNKLMAKKMRKINKKAAKLKTVPIRVGQREERMKTIKIRMVGIGSGGGTIVSEIASKMPKATFVAANTDLKALKTVSRKVIRFSFGQAQTHGLGTGMNAELGTEAALAEKDRIKNILTGQDLCILVASLGGGTSSGALPVFAKISKQLGNLTYGIFTLPFQFEGEKKMEIARDSLKKVKNYLNAFSVIPNERVFQIIDKTTPLKEALSIINKTLAESLEGLIETIYGPGLINIDFADFRTILEGRGRLAYLNTIIGGKKEGATKDLVAKVLSSPLYPFTIKGAKGVLFNISGDKNLSLAEVNQISKTISELANPEAKIIFGISQSQKYSDSIKITLLATGCGMKIFSKGQAKKRIKRKKEEKKVEAENPEVKKSIISARTQKRNPKKIIKIKVKKIVKNIKKEAPLVENKTPETKTSEIPKEPENGIQVRKNALQIRKETEEEEKEMLKKEQFWETPAFLRKKTE